MDAGPNRLGIIWGNNWGHSARDFCTTLEAHTSVMGEISSPQRAFPFARILESVTGLIRRGTLWRIQGDISVAGLN